MLTPARQTFRFRTRVQRLNSLSAEARASLNYQEQLQKFHAQQGHARVSIPIVDRRPVDLYSLKLVVASYGGPDAVVKNRKWSEVTRKLGYDERESSHLAAQVKAAYYKIILPFEKFLTAAKEQVKATSLSPAGVPSAAAAAAAAAAVLSRRGTPTPGGANAGRRDSLSPLPGAAAQPGPAATAMSDLTAAAAASPAPLAADAEAANRSLDPSPEPGAWGKDAPAAGTSADAADEANGKRRSSRKRLDVEGELSRCDLPSRRG